MGEKIKTLSKGNLVGNEFEIELNHPPISGGDQQIHIQSNKLRFELDKKDYILYALSILEAEKNLKKLKDLE
jgi:putative heme iron utilization protein